MGVEFRWSGAGDIVQKYILLSVLVALTILILGIWTSISIFIGGSIGFIIGEKYGIGWAIFGIILGGLLGIAFKKSISRKHPSQE